MTGIRCFSSCYLRIIKLLYLFLHLLIQIWSQNHNWNVLNVFFIVLSHNNARSENSQRTVRVFYDRSLNRGPLGYLASYAASQRRPLRGVYTRDMVVPGLIFFSGAKVALRFSWAEARSVPLLAAPPANSATVGPCRSSIRFWCGSPWVIWRPTPSPEKHTPFCFLGMVS